MFKITVFGTGSRGNSALVVMMIGSVIVPPDTV
jgi:hypothetical protein